MATVVNLGKLNCWGELSLSWGEFPSMFHVSIDNMKHSWNSRCFEMSRFNIWWRFSLSLFSRILAMFARKYLMKSLSFCGSAVKYVCIAHCTFTYVFDFVFVSKSEVILPQLCPGKTSRFTFMCSFLVLWTLHGAHNILRRCPADWENKLQEESNWPWWCNNGNFSQSAQQDHLQKGFCHFRRQNPRWNARRQQRFI